MQTRNITLVADVGLSDEVSKTLLALIQVVVNNIALTKLEVKRVEPPSAGLVSEYTYELETVDGRTWLQHIYFGQFPDDDPPMTFATGPAMGPDAGPGWRRVAEFAHARDVRNHIVLMINEHELTELTIEWDSP